MSFYSEIRIEPKKHVEEICENPYLVFSKDFIYYLAVVHDVDWRPNRTRPGYNSYQPHPLSPCTKNVKAAIEQIIGRSYLNYEYVYNEFVPEEAENKLEIFIDRANRILVKLTDNPLGAFFRLLHLGRWTMSFYKHGTKDAAHLVTHLMADALNKAIDNSSMWFFKFDMISHDLSELLKNGVAERFIEEYSIYVEELNEANEEDLNDDDDVNENDDEFDECSICVCGQCDDLFKCCGEYDDDIPDEDVPDEDVLDEDVLDEDDLDEDDQDESDQDETDQDDPDEEGYDEYENGDTEYGEILDDVEEEDGEENENGD